VLNRIMFMMVVIGSLVKNIICGIEEDVYSRPGKKSDIGCTIKSKVYNEIKGF